jgi:hypothetical protein
MLLASSAARIRQSAHSRASTSSGSNDDGFKRASWIARLAGSLCGGGSGMNNSEITSTTHSGLRGGHRLGGGDGRGRVVRATQHRRSHRGYDRPRQVQGSIGRFSRFIHGGRRRRVRSERNRRTLRRHERRFIFRRGPGRDARVHNSHRHCGIRQSRRRSSRRIRRVRRQDEPRLVGASAARTGPAQHRQSYPRGTPGLWRIRAQRTW